ncbi:sulfatase [Fuerstiella marisgermanici]|uniref:Choline-sulfatase n=1 Tax=Fuerstiella marisgermanici TaxID=1891926 RepID=A0A1P8WPM0_9PLAN|nr:sulfatase [Fuerstiella marisgermanici]APZ96001.1 Choline-sulfatase [Fuerstiella marisgermanici]
MSRLTKCLAFNLAVFCLNECAVVRADDPPPNVLLIAIDDLNDWVGCLGGHPQAKTPNIDALASRGVLFTNAHCQGPICGPSRACLLSGRYPYSTGVYNQPNRKDMQQDTVNFHGKLLPQYFAEHGYETLAVGKICHGYPDTLAFQTYGGKWDNFGPKPKNGRRFNYHLPDVAWTGTQTDWGAFPNTDSKMPDDKAASWAEQQLATPREKPFFMAVGFIRPHVPFYVPQKWFDMFPLNEVQLPAVRTDDLNDVPAISRAIHELPKYPTLDFLQRNNNEQFRLCVQAYLACTAFVDHQVGRVLKSLAESRHADNTIIVLFSDHGYHLGEKDRVSKHSLWEESTRVPLIILRPGSSAAVRSDLPVGLVDLYPTLTQLCHLPAKTSNEGTSLVPILNQTVTDWRFAISTTYAKDNHSLRSKRHRYIHYEDGTEELYDHEADLNEWNNLATSDTPPDILARFRRELPKHNAGYHPSTQSGAVNAWFQQHFKRHGVVK